MDMGRRCYTALMQFDEAGVIQVPVTWYFAADSAQIFPGPHSFGSSNWDSIPRQGIGVGEQWNSDFAWSNGAAPFYAPGSGSFCGTLDEFENGTSSDAPPIDYNDNGVPVCCPQPPCQPWVIFGPPARKFTRVLTGEVWGTSVSVPSLYKAGSSVHPGDQVQLHSDSLVHCGLLQRTIVIDMLVNTGSSLVPVQLDLVSYDLATTTGTWQVQPNPTRYGGEFFTFKNPLS